MDENAKASRPDRVDERPSAADFKQIGIVFPKEDVKELKLIAVEQGTTITALLADGAVIILEKHGRPVSAALRHDAGRQKLGRPPSR